MGSCRWKLRFGNTNAEFRCEPGNASCDQVAMWGGADPVQISTPFFGQPLAGQDCAGGWDSAAIFTPDRGRPTYDRLGSRHHRQRSVLGVPEPRPSTRCAQLALLQLRHQPLAGHHGEGLLFNPVSPVIPASPRTSPCGPRGAAGIDLCLHIVRADHGAAYAAEVARHMVMPPRREGGQLQSTRPPSPRRGQGSLAPVLDWAAGRLWEPITVQDLAAQAQLSPRTLARHFHQQVGVSPGRWVLTQRISAARTLLEETDLPDAPIDVKRRWSGPARRSGGARRRSLGIGGDQGRTIVRDQPSCHFHRHLRPLRPPTGGHSASSPEPDSLKQVSVMPSSVRTRRSKYSIRPRQPHQPAWWHPTESWAASR
jgi:AraC-like DNA-binding protein